MLRGAVEETRKVPEVEASEDEDEDLPLITLSASDKAAGWTVAYDKDENVYAVSGEKIEKFARRTNFDGFENVNRLRDIMKKMGITHELSRKGATGESVIRIGAREFTLLEQ